MRTFVNAKAMAKTLESALAARDVKISHSAALEIVAEQFGFRDWNTLSARISSEVRTDNGQISIEPAIPVLRSFSEDKAREFYEGFLGFRTDWEHRFAPDLPLYLQLSRGGVIVHISEHHGDATPGGTAFVRMTGIEAYHRELNAKKYQNMRPGVEKVDWGLEMTVIDPFGNRLRFCEQRHV
ncbi:glyoxalase [Terrihabitans soli]|uniref:Bleomycin resistance protein n=1 Tax=Terrihabitans soli TaxID=708113 RepID=A0A6S6QNX2_9HYPH|nr:glyoxalase superfamily protein [Terrihabitans soli]BCJ91156.1 glyoxalase [Terrihabitans soli]